MPPQPTRPHARPGWHVTAIPPPVSSPVVCTSCEVVVADAGDVDLAERLQAHRCDADTPVLILDHGHRPSPYRARCRRCLWRSQWAPTVGEVRAEHAEHLAAAHAEARAR